MDRIVPVLSTGPRAPSCRASSSAPASSIGPAGSGPTRRPSPRSSASSRRTCSTRSCRSAGDWPRRRSRWPTAGSRPASSGSCSASWASACSASTTSRCSPRSRRPGRLLFVEENIRQHGDERWASRSTPFRTWIALHETTHAFEFEAHPWLRPYLASRLERQMSAVRQRRPGDGPRGAARPRPFAPRRGRRRALDGAPDGRRAEAPVPRDPGGDEPARGLQRLRHGRGRPRAGPRRRADQCPVPRAPDASGRRSSGRCFG